MGQAEADHVKWAEEFSVAHRATTYLLRQLKIDGMGNCHPLRIGVEIVRWALKLHAYYLHVCSPSEGELCAARKLRA